MKTKVETNKAPLLRNGPFSHAIIADDFVFTQYSIYLTPEGK